MIVSLSNKNYFGFSLFCLLYLSLSGCSSNSSNSATTDSCPTTDKAYVANFTSNTVSVINLSTNTVCTTITVGSSPSIWENDLINNRIYTNNQGSDTVSVINTSTDMVVATHNSGNNPSALEFDRTLNQLYVVNVDDETLSVFTTTDFITYTEHAASPIDLPTGSAPHKVRANRDTGLVYVLATTNDMFVIDGNNLAGGVQTTVDLSPSNQTGSPTLRRLRIDRVNNKIYVTRSHSDTNADRLSIIDANNSHSVTNVTVTEGAFRLVLDDAGDVYVSGTSSTSTSVSHVDVSNSNTVNNLTSGEQPDGIRVTDDGTTVYVSNRGATGAGNTVSVISTANNTKTDVTVGVRPANLALSETLNRLIVSNRGANNTGSTVSIIDTTNNTVIATVSVGTAPGSVHIVE